MTINRLLIKNLRNISSAELKPCGAVNLIYGENGSGKTSILEAINLLALGRSFRSHKHKALIQYQQDSFTLFGKVITDDGAEVPLGLQRDLQGNLNCKANGVAVTGVAELAAYLPVQVINSETFLLLEGSPQVRRHFIDWLVFHVEHNFFSVWKDWQRCLKQRNSLLRHDRIEGFEIAIWDRELVGLTEQIHHYRTQCFSAFQDAFNGLIHEFLTLDGLKLSYQRGWDKERDYAQVLAESIERDKQLGYTHSGSHRADLRISIHGQPAAEILSRGQQKLLVCALKIAQGLVFQQMTGRKPLFLVDDLPAELDEKHRKRLAHWLDVMKTQVFITGVDKSDLLSSWADKPNIDIKMFHVEHGNLAETTDSIESASRSEHQQGSETVKTTE